MASTAMATRSGVATANALILLLGTAIFLNYVDRGSIARRRSADEGRP